MRTRGCSFILRAGSARFSKLCSSGQTHGRLRIRGGIRKGDWRAIEKSLEAVGLVHFYPEAHFHLAVGLERSGQLREAIVAYETALGLGYWPAALHGHLAELYQPIDSQKASEHQRTFTRLCRQPMYRADFKSRLTAEPPPNV